MNLTNTLSKEKPSLFSRIKNKALPYLFGATVGLFGGCGDSPSLPPAPNIVTGPVITNTQGEVDIEDTSKNLYHIIARDEKTLELLADMKIYTVNHSVEIPAIDDLKDYIAELKILPSEPQTLEILMSKVTDRISDNLPEYKTWFHPEPINWSAGTSKDPINETPIPMSGLADFYDTYESDAIVNLLEILPDLWGINTTAKGLASIRTQFLEHCDEISQILGLNPNEIFYDIYRENTTGMLYHVRVDGIGVSNTRPIVEIPYLKGTFSGNIQVPYNLKDAETDLCSILVKYSKDDITFLTATQGTGSDGISNLDSSLAGIDHIFVWDSKADNIGLTLEEIVKLRIIPSDSGGNGKKDERSIFIDNTKILFVSSRDGNREIYTMNVDGSNQTRLTNNTTTDGGMANGPGGSLNPPQWSPDGSKIAFMSYRDGNWEIYVMNANGSNQINLSNNPTNVDYEPTWSPDGTQIAFHSNRSGNREIYTVNTDGSNIVKLTNSPGTDHSPAWSPDGRIAFSSIRDNSYGEMYVMNSDGTNVVRLTNNFQTNEDDPTWSPDGSKIAFVLGRTGEWNEIYTMNADGTNQTRLTNNPAFDGYPEWSPDGTKIAFLSDRDGNYNIYIINKDGSGLRRLINNPAYNQQPSWSPDGTRIAFDSTIDGSGIYIINADGTNLIRLNNSGSTSNWWP